MHIITVITTYIISVCQLTTVGHGSGIYGVKGNIVFTTEKIRLYRKSTLDTPDRALIRTVSTELPINSDAPDPEILPEKAEIIQNIKKHYLLRNDNIYELKGKKWQLYEYHTSSAIACGSRLYFIKDGKLCRKNRKNCLHLPHGLKSGWCNNSNLMLWNLKGLSCIFKNENYFCNRQKSGFIHVPCGLNRVCLLNGNGIFTLNGHTVYKGNISKLLPFKNGFYFISRGKLYRKINSGKIEECIFPGSIRSISGSGDRAYLWSQSAVYAPVSIWTAREYSLFLQLLRQQISVCLGSIINVPSFSEYSIYIPEISVSIQKTESSSMLQKSNIFGGFVNFTWQIQKSEISKKKQLIDEILKHNRETTARCISLKKWYRYLKNNSPPFKRSN
ncbi:MAG: hypothetical protein JXR95_13465 [Deltaproteobacteria bacterium]|nr:hypothetical protein [Deltaproteobacteria bacterium]